jgi:AraC-like DNA-binding protein
MNSSTKQQISANLDKAKTAGGQRLERIGKIIQSALSETVSELKAGGSELQSIAKESTLIETLKPKSTASAPTTSASAPVEVTIDDEDKTSDIVVNPAVAGLADTETVAAPITDEQIAESILEGVQPVPASPASSEFIGTEPANPIDPASTDAVPAAPTPAEPAVQSLIDSLNAATERVVAFVNDEKTQATVQPYLTKLKSALQLLDEKIAARYGERYSAFKQEFRQDMGKAKTWYTETRSNVNENGAGWVDQKQAELETKVGEAGATIAQTEVKVKEIAKEVWQTVRKS